MRGGGGLGYPFPMRCAAALCLLLLLFLSSALPAAAESEEPDLSRANAVYLYQPENDQVLAAKNIDLPIFPASTVKIMTGLLATEALQGRYAETVTITQEMVNAASGFRMYLNPGETVTVEQMLQAGICAGYNDACVVLAYLVCGSVDAFVAQMNLRAAELGMSATMYTNPTGMHSERMVTTVADTARLAMAAMENEAYMALVSKTKFTIPANNIAPARTCYNRNALIARNVTSRYYNKSVTGMSAGTTSEGGYCIVATAEQPSQGLRYLCIVMGADEDSEELGGTIYSYELANELLHYAMNDFGMIKVLDREMAVTRVDVGLTEKKTTVALYPCESVNAYLPASVAEEDLQYRVMLNEKTVKAPIEAGEVLGFVTVSCGGELLASVEICAAEDVEASAFLTGLERISAYTASRRFILICVYAAVLLLGYFVILPYLRKRRNRKRAKFY